MFVEALIKSAVKLSSSIYRTFWIKYIQEFINVRSWNFVIFVYTLTSMQWQLIRISAPPAVMHSN